MQVTKLWRATTLGLVALLVTCLMISCSDEQDVSKGIGPDDQRTDAGDSYTAEGETSAFQQALREGKYRFSVDASGDLVPCDGDHVPMGEEDLYAAFLALSEVPLGREIAPTKATSALPDNWRYAVWREICFALSRTKYLEGQYGQSTRVYTWQGSTWLAGDWNYDGLGIGIGGECKYFASRIVTRGTGGRYSLPSGYEYATVDIGLARPGDVIQRPPRYGTQHTAIVFEILNRDNYGRATRIDVIDANFVGGRGSKLIARHYFPYGSWPLSQFRVW